MFGRKKEYSDDSVSGYFSELDERSKKESDVFVSSLDNLKPSDLIADDDGTADRLAKKKHTRNTAGSIISGLLAAVFAMIFVYCVWQIVLYTIDYVKSDEFYDDIANGFAGALGFSDKVSVYELEREEDSAPMQSYSDIQQNGARTVDPSLLSVRTKFSQQFLTVRVQIESLKRKNEDIYGFINIESTKIRYYPLVQAADNEYYLDHDVDRNNRASGALFVDYRNSKTVERNRNIVVYGHNIEHGGMFHDLMNYLNEPFFNEKDIVVYTTDGIYTFTVFSVYPTRYDADYFRTYFWGDADFIDFCVQEEANSLFHKPDLEFKRDSVILTLSTCINGMKEGRYAIHALLTKIEH